MTRAHPSRWARALLGAALLAPVASCTRAADTESAPGAVGLTARAEGVRLFVREIGGAATLIVVNGGPGASHECAARLAQLASPSLRVVLFDPRGMGRSTAPRDPARYALDDYVLDLDGLRTSLGLEKMHVLGHSHGGLVAMAYAAAHPERVASLVLVSPRAPDWADDRTANASFEQRVAALVAKRQIPAEPPSDDGDDCRASSAAYLPALFFDPTFLERIPAPLPESRETACSTRVREATEASLPGYDLRPRLATFQAPTLLVSGDGDPFGATPRESTRRALAAANPEVKLLTRCGHFPWIECSDAFKAAVLPFLARVTALPSAR